MATDRRGFLRAAAAGAGLACAASLADRVRAIGGDLRLSMCDWSLGKMANVEGVALAAEIGLDGLEVSIGSEGDNLRLREPAVQEEYRAARDRYQIAFPSMAMGLLNSVPLKSEERAAGWVGDTIEAARSLGAGCILLAFFGDGTLDMADEAGITRVVEVLRREAPHAEEAGIVLGLENTLSAEDNLAILERVESEWVRVYYDLRNSADCGRDVPAEIRTLGDRICMVHLKNGGHLLSEKENVDFPACAEALYEIGYGGWLVLETACPNDVILDTRANAAFVRETFL